MLGGVQVLDDQGTRTRPQNAAEGVPSPTMNLDERRAADRNLARMRRDARADYVEQSETAARADAEYRKAKSLAYLAARDEGLPASGCEVVSNAAGAEAKQRRDIAASLAKAALLRIQEAEREAVTVRDIHSTSERIDGLAA